jgi:hypothetical protein
MQNEFFYQLSNSQPRRRIVLRNGMYLVKRPIIDYKAGEHYGVMICGKTLRKLRFPENRFPENRSIIIHKTDQGISPIWTDISGKWHLVNGGTVLPNQIDEAITRIKISLATPNYHLIFSNCEHFARFVTQGIAQSTQVQNVVVVGGLAALFLLSND